MSQSRVKISLIITAIFILFFTCGQDNDPTVVTPGGDTLFSGDWSIDKNKVKSGGPGVDGIPALENPNMITIQEATYLSDNDLVIGYKVGSDIRAYPHKILDWHEIINDEIGGQKVAITYCPLTGTTIAWDRNIDGGTTTFGVSGLLFNSNLIPYDRKTGSAWSQMKMESVNGKVIGTIIDTYPTVETTWKTWKKMYPETIVVSTNTGISRNYASFPYFSNGKDYRIDPFLIFPIDIDDDRLPRKERVLGVIVNNKARAYKLADMTSPVTVVQDEFNGESLVIIGSQEKNYIVSYKSQLDDNTKLTFTAIENSEPTVMKDNEGNEWNVFGEAISGDRKGQKLLSTTSYIGYWFAWGTFYPNLEIY